MYNVDCYLTGSGRIGFDVDSHNKATKIIKEIHDISGCNMVEMYREEAKHHDVIIIASVSSKSQAEFFLNKYDGTGSHLLDNHFAYND